MNPEQLFKNLSRLGSALSGKQIAGLVTVFVAVCAVVAGSAYWLSVPTYTLLVTDMDAETSSAVVSRLRTERVPYELSDGGRTVSVPVERADELRLDLASGGLPSAGRIGFEIFDRPAFGTTEFLEQVNYRRALEGELARTIATLSEVSGARVHIAMARDSLFVDRSQPAKASVVLKLRSTRPLPPATINGIAGLVSGSVEGLRPEAVTILDTQGRPLTRPSDDSAAATTGMQFERQQQIERDLTTRVLTMLEPVVGVGRVRVNVAAVLNTDMVEETQELWDPQAVVRSRQTTTDTTASALPVGGIAGARANTPPPAPDPEMTGTATADGAATAAVEPPAARTAAVAPPPAGGRTSEVTNYELGKTTRHVISPQGQLARLSVAVILDDERVPGAPGDATAQPATRSWQPDGLQRIHAIVSAAVGLDPDRGDQLIVENIPFEVPDLVPEPADPGTGDQVMTLLKQYGPSALRTSAILVVAMVALFGILRPLSRRALGLATPPSLPAAAGTAKLPTVREMEGKIDGSSASPAAGQARLPVLTQRVVKLASDEPEQLARIVRGWIAEGER